MMNGSGMMGMMVWGWIFLIVLLGLLVAVVVFVVSGQRTSTTAPDALGILRKRYARGEIDRTAYEERAAVLRGQAPPAQQP